MENKEVNAEKETAALEKDTLDKVSGGRWITDSVSGGHWDEDAPISKKTWERMSVYERYTFRTLTQRCDAMLEERNHAKARYYFGEAVAFQNEMLRKYL